MVPYAASVPDWPGAGLTLRACLDSLKGNRLYPEFQVIRGFSQKIPAGVLSYDQIHS